MGQRNAQEGNRRWGRKQVSRWKERRKSREGRLELETEHRGKKRKLEERRTKQTEARTMREKQTAIKRSGKCYRGMKNSRPGGAR